MRTYFFILTASILCAASCRDDDQSTTLDEDNKKLEIQLEEIRAFAHSLSCDDPATWAYAPYGAKPCGGPWGYIAYSTDLDTDQLFSMLEDYDQANRELNEKWGLISNCALEPTPTGVVCDDGNPVLVFD